MSYSSLKTILVLLILTTVVALNVTSTNSKSQFMDVTELVPIDANNMKYTALLSSNFKERKVAVTTGYVVLAVVAVFVVQSAIGRCYEDKTINQSVLEIMKEKDNKKYLMSKLDG